MSRKPQGGKVHGGLDKKGLRQRDQAFARQVLAVLEATQRNDPPPAEVSPDAVRLVSSLIFLGAQAEEFLITCPTINDPRIAVALNARQLVRDILNRRRHPIEMFFSGVGGVKNYADRVATQDRYRKTTLGVCVQTVLRLLSQSMVSRPTVMMAVDRVWGNAEIKKFCETDKVLEHCYYEALKISEDKTEKFIEALLVRSENIDDVIENTLRLLYFSDQPTDPRGAREVRTHRLYYRLEKDGTTTIEIPPDSPLRGRLVQQVMQALADQDDTPALDEKL